MRNSSRRRRLLRLLWTIFFVILALSHFLILDHLALAFLSSEDDEHDVHSNRTTQYMNAVQKLHRQQQQGARSSYLAQFKRSSKHRLGNSDIKTIMINAKASKSLNEAPYRMLNISHRQGIVDHPSNNTSNDTSFLKLMEQGIDIPEDQREEIPSWKNITDLFGTEPVILGLETCEAYRKAVYPIQRIITTAGMFNTGTNLFTPFFANNCDGFFLKALLQVPWGKHNLAQARVDNYTVNKTIYHNLNPDHVLPVVMVRHPISWMFSTCVHSYGAHWRHSTTNCPHLVNENITEDSLLTVRVGFGYNPSGQRYTKFRSLIHLWKEWYQDYLNHFPHPRLIIRLEDVVYQPETVLEKICDCADGTPRPDNKVIVPQESVKVKRDRIREMEGHRPTLTRGRETAGLLKAWKNHASIASLWERMDPRDRRIVQQVLKEEDAGELLRAFGYKIDGL